MSVVERQDALPGVVDVGHAGHVDDVVVALGHLFENGLVGCPGAGQDGHPVAR